MSASSANLIYITLLPLLPRLEVLLSSPWADNGVDIDDMSLDFFLVALFPNIQHNCQYNIEHPIGSKKAEDKKQKTESTVFPKSS